MDELLKAITGLINTGGDLAGDALYLYFALKIIEPISVGLTLFGITRVICRTILQMKEKRWAGRN